LNDSPLVSERTRTVVLQAIEDLDYSPNLIARRFSLQRTHTVAVILRLFTLPSFVERLRGIQHILAESGYDLVLYSVETVEQRDNYFRALVRRASVDGILVISIPPDDQQAERFVEAGIPVVLLDAENSRLNEVIIDDVAGGAMATQHLINLGHSQIAFLSDFLETNFHESMRYRYEGYLQALREAEIPFQPEYHVYDHHGRLEAHHLAKKLLSLPNPPTAIFAASDTQAIGVLDAARDLGIRVPDQLSVIGFDDIRDADFVNLTTIRQPLYQSGVRGVTRLLEIIDSEDWGEPVREVLPLELVVRNTTAPFGEVALNSVEQV
jgi:DNA-binding LacI/PurR family transcriptional regulator